MGMRSVRKVRIHCPVSAQTFAALLRGELAAIEADANAARVLAIIRARNPLGDFDMYQGVFELSFGIEGFTATDRAKPAAGETGRNTLSPTAVITTYFQTDADAGALQTALGELMNAHPWETPVIEITEQPTRLLQRQR